MSGNRIKAVRQQRGLSAQKLADLMNTGRSTIVKLERGDRRLTIDWLDRFSLALGVPITDLILDVGDNSFSKIVDCPVIPIRELCKESDPHRTLAALDGRAGALRENVVLQEVNSKRIVGILLEDASAGRFVPAGGIAIVDLDDRNLSEGAVYLVFHDSRAEIREFTSSGGPARLQCASHAQSGRPLFLGSDKVEILGRVIGSQIKL